MNRTWLTSATVPGALAEMRRRIREDQRAVSSEVAGVLEGIARGLDDPGFSVRATPRKLLGRFRLATGVEAAAYLDQRRLEVAHHLARHSDVPVAEIAEGLGFPSRELFTKWFTARLGEAPDRLRKSARGDACPVRKEADPGIEGGGWQPGDDWPTEWDWDRLVLGAVSPEEAHRLLLILLVTYPELERELPREVPVS